MVTTTHARYGQAVVTSMSVTVLHEATLRAISRAFIECHAPPSWLRILDVSQPEHTADDASPHPVPFRETFQRHNPKKNSGRFFQDLLQQFL